MANDRQVLDGSRDALNASPDEHKNAEWVANFAGYTYAGDDPVNGGDPSGLKEKPQPTSSTSPNSACPPTPSAAWQCRVVALEGSEFSTANLTKEFDWPADGSATGIGFAVDDETTLPGGFVLAVCQTLYSSSCVGSWDYAWSWYSSGFGLGPFVSAPLTPASNGCPTYKFRVTVDRWEAPAPGVLSLLGEAMMWVVYVYFKA